MIKASIFYSALLTLSGVAFLSIHRDVRDLPGSTSLKRERKYVNDIVVRQHFQPQRDFNLENRKQVRNPPDKAAYSKLSIDNQSCDGRLLYVYELPATFNVKISHFCKKMYKFIPTCPNTQNFGFGVPAFKEGEISKSVLVPLDSWFRTDQFNLEPIIHRRILQYPCLTKDPNKANLFFIPFYSGLSVCETLYQNGTEERDRISRDLIHWLEKHDSWHRNKGRDHVIVLGRVVWDFLRTVVSEDWGNTFLRMPQMTNVIGLSIEGSSAPPYNGVHSVPYPTSFHPRNLGEILKWQKEIRKAKRPYLASFMGSFHGMGSSVRHKLYALCKKYNPECSTRKCSYTNCLYPQKTVEFYMTSKFCLMPPGDTPTRKAFFDCILAGTVPVIFNRQSSEIYEWYFPPDINSYSIFIPEEKILESGNASLVFSTLRAIPEYEIIKMRENLINILPTLIYNHPEGNFDAFHVDAFGVIMSKIFEVSRKQSNM